MPPACSPVAGGLLALPAFAPHANMPHAFLPSSLSHKECPISHTHTYPSLSHHLAHAPRPPFALCCICTRLRTRHHSAPFCPQPLMPFSPAHEIAKPSGGLVHACAPPPHPPSTPPLNTRPPIRNDSDNTCARSPPCPALSACLLASPTQHCFPLPSPALPVRTAQHHLQNAFSHWSHRLPVHCAPVFWAALLLAPASCCSSSIFFSQPEARHPRTRPPPPFEPSTDPSPRPPFPTSHGTNNNVPLLSRPTPCLHAAPRSPRSPSTALPQPTGQ